MFQHQTDRASPSSTCRRPGFSLASDRAPNKKTDPTTTADASSDFDDIVSAISTTGGLYPAVLEARAKLQREHPAGYALTLIAHEVWPQLSDVAKVRALEMLFTVYVLRLHDEERDARLGRDAAAGVTHLETDDLLIPTPLRSSPTATPIADSSTTPSPTSSSSSGVSAASTLTMAYLTVTSSPPPSTSGSAPRATHPTSPRSSHRLHEQPARTTAMARARNSAG
ncbi:hypothetical protein AB0O86_24385 [Streptomyces hirsutus]|uniref:hypothetical protein n=1 Tax=Streptomyces hirsutus TaxID=35620 RepID=UPI00342ADBE3